MFKLNIIFFLIIFSFSLHGKYPLCKGVTFLSQNISFSQTEKGLICDETGGDSWKTITPKQKEFFLVSFLQNRAYYYPKFTHIDHETIVDPGSQALINEVFLENDILNINPRKFWTIFNEPMTSSSLNLLEDWVKRQYSLKGYPCILIETKAIPKENLVSIKIQDPEVKTFGKVISERIPGLNFGVEKRYQAFSKGNIYNSIAVDLTERRLESDELVVKTNISPKCIKKSTSVDLDQNIMPGKSKLLSFGLGFDSDEFFILEATGKNSRFLSQASLLQSRLYASWQKQKIDFTYKWYYAPVITRHHLHSKIEFERQNTHYFETLSLLAQFGPVVDFDLENSRLEFSLSPSYSLTHTSRGEGPPLSQNIAIKSMAKIESHKFEFYKDSPQSGYTFQVDLSHTQKGIGSDYTATSYAFSGKYLHNLLDLEPAIWILGLRGLLSGIHFEESFTSKIPPTLFHRLGGTDSIRGFAKNKIPKDKPLLTAYLGSEVRISNLLPWGIHPFVFFDIAKAKTKNSNFSDATFMSLGIGLQWDSPIGLFRFSTAYPIVDGKNKENYSNLSGFHFHLGLGEQF